jgi:hypothetical protein
MQSPQLRLEHSSLNSIASGARIDVLFLMVSPTTLCDPRFIFIFQCEDHVRIPDNQAQQRAWIFCDRFRNHGAAFCTQVHHSFPCAIFSRISSARFSARIFSGIGMRRSGAARRGGLFRRMRGGSLTSARIGA